MMLALKSGPKIAGKTGNPAGLLFRRIWYSVGKSAVLGITEYRQGQPMQCVHYRPTIYVSQALFIPGLLNVIILGLPYVSVEQFCSF